MITFEVLFYKKTNMNAKKNYVSEYMFTSRIVSHGRIERLDKPFMLKDDQPFSLYIRPKSAVTYTADVLVDVKLYKEEACSPCPVSMNCWQELMVCEVSTANAALLEKYEIYWGCGNGATLPTE